MLHENPDVSLFNRRIAAAGRPNVRPRVFRGHATISMRRYNRDRSHGRVIATTRATTWTRRRDRDASSTMTTTTSVFFFRDDGRHRMTRRKLPVVRQEAVCQDEPSPLITFQVVRPFEKPAFHLRPAALRFAHAVGFA